MIAGRYRYIAIEGPIGAGKTSLARKLAEHYQAHTLLEKPETNPFLERFYTDRKRFALPTQLFFLFQRVQQLAEVRQLDMFQSVLFADFLLDKDPLFARLTLADDELHLYEQILAQLRPQTTAPDLVDPPAGQPGNPGRARCSTRQSNRSQDRRNLSRARWRRATTAFSTNTRPRRC